MPLIMLPVTVKPSMKNALNPPPRLSLIVQLITARSAVWPGELSLKMTPLEIGTVLLVKTQFLIVALLSLTR